MSNPRTECEHALARFYAEHEGLAEDDKTRALFEVGVAKILQAHVPPKLRKFRMAKSRAGRWEVIHCAEFHRWLEGGA